MASLVDAISERIRLLQGSTARHEEAYSTDYAPLSDAELDRAEARFGYRLPEAARAVYRSIGNGGFGPAYGLLGFIGGRLQEEGCDALSQYEAYRRPDSNDPAWAWPAGLLPLVHLGCAMYFCVDCTTDDGDVVWFEPNVHDDEASWQDSFFPLRVTFEELMRLWASGDTLEELMERASSDGSSGEGELT